MNKIYIVRLASCHGCKVDYEYSIKAIFAKKENAVQYVETLATKDGRWVFEINEHELKDNLFDQFGLK